MADVLSVSALNTYLRSVLEEDRFLCDIAVRGEISNFHRSAKTGHVYFTLSDAKAGVRVVMFRTAAQAVPFAAANGMRVVARGRVSMYEREGDCQLYAEYLFEDGAGAAREALEALKERLSREGLFSDARKRPIPKLPRKIGLVTSESGAALQDILAVARQRSASVCFVLAAAGVQGAGAQPEITAALHALQAREDVDLIIIARGGGAAEDLSVFNSESVVRAVCACTKPVISAIGHETDVTLVDFAADLRAPTPSAAAELALPDAAEFRRRMAYIYSSIANIIHMRMELCYNRFGRCASHAALAAPHRALAAAGSGLAESMSAAARCAAGGVNAAAARLGAAARLAEGLSPYAVLGRGYALVTSENAPVRSVCAVSEGQRVGVRLSDGVLACRVESVLEEAPEHMGGGAW